MAREEARQAILDEVDKDVTQSNGPNFVKGKLKDRGIMVSRCVLGHHVTHAVTVTQLGNLFPSRVVRQTMRDHFPQSFEERYPGKRKTLVPRQGLTALGPFHEICSDGHEKLGKQGLQMGNVGLSIYAWKDKWSGCLLKIVVTPDCRSAGAVGHLFLDLLEQLGGMSQPNDAYED